MNPLPQGAFNIHKVSAIKLLAWPCKNQFSCLWLDVLSLSIVPLPLTTYYKLISGERDELRKGKETVNGFKQTVNVMGLEIHQMKEVVEREIELIPSLQHDSIYYQKERINLMKKEREEEQQMLDQIQDGKQEVEVTEHRLNMVIKVNNEEIMKSKAEILDLSQVIRSMFLD